ncbi:hypothetical protein C8R43DRAFT_496618 [Mycena crocata]|nr:hypothetical protein C8R43DRAFT_496618 [Mycena crocata]
MAHPIPPVDEARKPDRSVVSAAGAAVAAVEKLRPETARYFDRDPTTGEVLWFPAPPMHVARTPSPRHRLEYLDFLAQKYNSEDINPTPAPQPGVTADSTQIDGTEVVYISASETIREALRSVVHS